LTGQQAVKKQQVIDVKLCYLLQTMLDVYSFVEDLELLSDSDKIKSLEEKALAIVKQTVECALFIQEYTMNGFCRTFCSRNCCHIQISLRSCSSKSHQLGRCRKDNRRSIQRAHQVKRFPGRWNGRPSLVSIHESAPEAGWFGWVIVFTFNRWAKG
jgi:hypothetical protein